MHDSEVGVGPLLGVGLSESRGGSRQKSQSSACSELRFIDGQTSNDALFKYLMDNAVASKTDLNLSIGVSLMSEQVAALTHDIVWMEFFVNNAKTNYEQLIKHIDKADIVPLDYRNLTLDNQRLVTSWIEGLPAASKDKILILR